MDKFSFVRSDGISRLPPGFRFQPTEEELVFQYLKCKVFSCALPASIIPEVNNVCNYDPWDLPPPGCDHTDTEEERYLFSNESNNRNRNRNRGTKRSTPSGYWKATGSEKRIVSSESNSSVGMKKTLVFYKRKACGGRGYAKTGWVMHEYRLVSVSAQTSASSSTSPLHFHHRYSNSKEDGGGKSQMEKWVLCIIFFKNGMQNHDNNEMAQSINKDRAKDNDDYDTESHDDTENVLMAESRFYNFRSMDSISSTASSSSSSTHFTDITSGRSFF